ncbi:MAG: hypothetical protein OJF62_002518 [Pseudolabrys sp.]|jgi:hypothetical protein|nr:hypothetical protein [Pseudolabrys sp.]
MSRERCRKISLASKIAIAAGAAWIALTLLGIVAYNPAPAFGGLAAVIGGIVLLGSNKTTWDQIEIALRDAEAKRNALIGSLPLRLVIDAPQTTLH